MLQSQNTYFHPHKAPFTNRIISIDLPPKQLIKILAHVDGKPNLFYVLIKEIRIYLALYSTALYSI